MTSEYIISPRRLVFLQLGCMFCPEPQGETYMTHVALETKLGYMSCSRSECQAKMKTAVDYWHTHHAYGKANYLKHRTDLKIKRSNGDIEEGWRLMNPAIRYEGDGATSIECYNQNKNIGKWCAIESILELNPL
jgi:hypothetical protein